MHQVNFSHKKEICCTKMKPLLTNAVIIIKKQFLHSKTKQFYFVLRMNTTFRRRTNTVFKFDYVSTVFIQNQLKSLKRNKAAGADGFPPGMLKDCRMHISKPLHHIINLSLESRTVLPSWKIGKVAPIHKREILPIHRTIVPYLWFRYCQIFLKKQHIFK